MRVHNVLVSVQFDPSVTLDVVRDGIRKKVLDIVLPKELVD